MEGIARRAGVGKAAVYRRWRSKLPLVLDVVSAVAAAGLPTPDTGSLLRRRAPLLGGRRAGPAAPRGRADPPRPARGGRPQPGHRRDPPRRRCARRSGGIVTAIVAPGRRPRRAPRRHGPGPRRRPPRPARSTGAWPSFRHRLHPARARRPRHRHDRQRCGPEGPPSPAPRAPGDLPALPRSSGLRSSRPRPPGEGDAAPVSRPAPAQGAPAASIGPAARAPATGWTRTSRAPATARAARLGPCSGRRAGAVRPMGNPGAPALEEPVEPVVARGWVCGRRLSGGEPPSVRTGAGSERRGGSLRCGRRQPPPRRRGPRWPPPRSACGRRRGSAARRPATCGPRRPARRCRRRTAAPTRAARPRRSRSAASTSAAGHVPRRPRARRPASRPGRSRRAGAGGRRRRRRPPAASRSSSIAQVRGGSPSAATTRGCSSPGVADDRPRRRSSAAHRPGCQGACWSGAHVELDAGRRAATARAASTASAQVGRRGPAPHQPARLAVAGQHRGRRCSGCSGSAASSAASSSSRRPAVDAAARRRPRGASARGPEDQPGLEQRHVARSRGRRCGAACASSPGSSVVRSSGSSSASGLASRSGAAPRVVGRQAERVEAAVADERVARAPRRSPAPASARPTRRRSRCASVRPRPAGGRGSTTGMLVVALEPDDLLGEVVRVASGRGASVGGVTTQRRPRAGRPSQPTSWQAARRRSRRP